MTDTTAANPELGPDFPAGFITQFQAKLAELLPCIGDTDGDGDCPLALCPHCRPGNFTHEQLLKIYAQHSMENDKSPHLAMVVLFPAYEQVDPDNEIVVASLNCPIVDDPRDQRRLVRGGTYPIGSKAHFLSYAETMWDAYVQHLASHGVQVRPEPGTEEST